MLTIIEIIVLVIYVGYLVFEYASKDVPGYIKFLTFISWVISFSIVFIIPHDIYYVSCISKNICLKTNHHSDMSALITIWRIIYWMNFILTWYFLL